jgi:hypothetical protein
MRFENRNVIVGLITSVALLFGSLAQAEMESSDEANLAYVMISGSFVPTQPTGGYDNLTTDVQKGIGGGVDFGYRFGKFALETGVHAMKQAWIANYIKGTAPYNELINYGYVAVPAVAKWNYIETRLSTFYVKGGMSLDFATQRSNEDLIPVQFVSGLAGIGGTAELSDHAAFLLDICGVQHFGFDSKPPADAVISVGFLIAL